MMSAGGLRQVDHQIVDLKRNWTRATAPLARGEGEEHGERWHWTIRSPEARRRRGLAAAEEGPRWESGTERGRRREERLGGAPAHPECVGQLAGEGGGRSRLEVEKHVRRLGPTGPGAGRCRRRRRPGDEAGEARSRGEVEEALGGAPACGDEAAAAPGMDELGAVVGRRQRRLLGRRAAWGWEAR